VVELVDDVQHALALARRHFLRVAGKRDRLEVVVRQVDVTQRRVGNVFDVRPADAKLAAEPVVRPDARFAGEVDATDHFRDSAKLATVIHAEQEDSGPVVMMVLVGIVQFLVPVVRGTPNPMLNRRSDILLGVALYDIKSGVRWVDVIIMGIEAAILRWHR